MTINRLQHLRLLDNLTAKSVAETLNMPPSTYTAIERGSRSGPIDATILGYSQKRLETPIPNISEPFHRQKASIGVKAVRANREHIRLAGELAGELRSRLSKCPKVSIEPIKISGLSEIESAANECRYLLRLEPDAPIRNLTSAFERAGIAITPIYTNPNDPSKRVDGLSAWVEDQPTIGINPNSPGDRFRLTLGHELGHLLLHTRPTPTVEDEANLFASTLLIPTEYFLRYVNPKSTLQDFATIKHQWGISIAACIYRAHQLEVIDKDRYRSLQIQMSGWKHQEPGTFPIKPGRLLPKMVDSVGGISSTFRLTGFSKKHLIRATNWNVSLRSNLQLIHGSKIFGSGQSSAKLRAI